MNAFTLSTSIPEIVAMDDATFLEFCRWLREDARSVEASTAAPTYQRVEIETVADMAKVVPGRIDAFLVDLADFRTTARNAEKVGVTEQEIEAFIDNHLAAGLTPEQRATVTPEMRKTIADGLLAAAGQMKELMGRPQKMTWLDNGEHKAIVNLKIAEPDGNLVHESTIVYDNRPSTRGPS